MARAPGSPGARIRGRHWAATAWYDAWSGSPPRGKRPPPRSSSIRSGTPAVSSPSPSAPTGGSWPRPCCGADLLHPGSTPDSSGPGSDLDRRRLAADLAPLALADPRAVEDGHVACPGMAVLAAGQAEEVRPAAHEQIEPVPGDVSTRVIRDHATVVHVAAPGLPARHRAALEQRDVEQGTELHDLRIDRHGPERLQRLAVPRRPPRGASHLEARAVVAVARAPDIDHAAIAQLASALHGDLGCKLLRYFGDRLALTAAR